MQTVTKTILASLALVGTVAAVAPAANAQGYGYGQPYGYEPYGSQDQGYNRYGEHYVCGRNLAKVTNFIIDPANGRPITQAEYQARYPWTDTSTWIYDCATNLWTDHTSQGAGYNQQSQNYRWDRDRGRNRYYGRDR